jgi:hypothetical protein
MFIAGFLILGTMMTASAEDSRIVISDNFNREYNQTDEVVENYCDLGKTKEGYQWNRRDFNKNGADPHHPGLLEYKKGDKALIWRGATSTADLIFLGAPETKLKNFTLDFDYIRKAKPSIHACVINFRMQRAGGAVSDGGATPGYSLIIYPTSKQSLKLKFKTDYGLIKESAEFAWNGTIAHINLLALGNHFKVYVGETPALDVVDETSNSAALAPGFFTIQFNSFLNGEHGIDNFIVLAH